MCQGRGDVFCFGLGFWEGLVERGPLTLFGWGAGGRDGGVSTARTRERSRERESRALSAAACSLLTDAQGNDGDVVAGGDARAEHRAGWCFLCGWATGRVREGREVSLPLFCVRSRAFAIVRGGEKEEECVCACLGMLVAVAVCDLCECDSVCVRCSGGAGAGAFVLRARRRAAWALVGHRRGLSRLGSRNSSQLNSRPPSSFT